MMTARLGNDRTSTMEVLKKEKQADRLSDVAKLVD